MNRKVQTKKSYLDLLRIVAIFMVFHFHFIIVLEKQGILYGFANGDWGCVGTSLFFLISGNCLARNYGSELHIKSFYAKRWLSIFPTFYLCYVLVLFGHTVLLQNRVLAGLAPWRLIFTVLGVDNYLNFLGIQNGALVGEWYTAIILGIYLLFPLLQLLYRKSKILGSLLIYGLYTANLFLTWGSVPDDAHILTGIAMFWTGMLLYRFEEHLEHLHWGILLPILLTAFRLFSIELSGPQLLRKNLLAFLIFLLFMRLGGLTDKAEYLVSSNITTRPKENVLTRILESAPIRFLSRIEYGIYLCHHTVLYVMKSIYTHILGEINPGLYYILCLAATLIFATVLTYLTQWIIGGIKKWFKK